MMGLDTTELIRESDLDSRFFTMEMIMNICWNEKKKEWREEEETLSESAALLLLY